MKFTILTISIGIHPDILLHNKQHQHLLCLKVTRDMALRYEVGQEFEIDLSALEPPSVLKDAI